VINNPSSTTRNENVVRACERIKGSIREIPDEGNNLPVNAARPNDADIPHRTAEQAM
jgi:hypothetical protein